MGVRGIITGVVWLGLHGLALAQPQEDIAWLPGTQLVGNIKISADGRFVGWSDNDIGPAGVTSLQIHDRASGSTVEPALPMRFGNPVHARMMGFYGNGAGIVIITGAPLLFDTDLTMCNPPGEDCNGPGGNDVYLFDLGSGAVTRVSLTTTGDEVPAATVFGAAVSEDGSRVAIVGDRHVLPDSNGFHEVYVRDLRGGTPMTTRITIDMTGDDPNGEVQDEVAISPDGNFVAFSSMASDLVPGDTNGTWDVFVANVDTGAIERVSVRSDGSEVASPSGHFIVLGPQISLSYDGRFVAFMSAAEDLVGSDIGRGPDIFVHDRVTHETTLATGDAACGARDGGNYGPSLSWDGQVLSFLTRDPCYSSMPLSLQAAVIQLVTRETVTVSVPLDASPPNGPVETAMLSAGGDLVAFSSESTNLSMPGPMPFPGRRSAYATMPFRDRDGDGLLDNWEELGLDVGGDGTVDLDLASIGALSDRKDIFVEVDWMRGMDHEHWPSAIARGQVVDAFDAAPVENPDGTTGIRLHFLVSDTLIEAPGNVPLDDFVGLQRIKRTLFGNPSDAVPGAEQRLIARSLVFRYLLMAHDQADMASSGLGELPGDDFIVTLGGFTGQVGTVDEQAGTIMHELGHTLGLRHGGLDDVNCKPNYISVMNYTFQFLDLVPERRLDYGYALPALNEARLDETVGLAGPDMMRTIFGPRRSITGGPVQLVRVPASGTVDWDEDGDPTEVVARNINNLGFDGCRSAGGETLVTRDDWSNIIYDFRRTPGYGRGASTTHESEITRAIVDEMRTLLGDAVNLPPIAVAGAPVTIDEETTVMLDSAGSSDPEGAPITFTWMQGDGPAGSLSATDVARPVFTAPRVDGDVTIPIELAVRDGVLFSVPALQMVTVIDRGGPPADAGVGVDAGAARDGGGAMDADAGPGGGPPTAGGGGCDCRVTTGGSSRSSKAGFVLGLGVLLALVLRRARVIK